MRLSNERRYVPFFDLRFSFTDPLRSCAILHHWRLDFDREQVFQWVSDGDGQNKFKKYALRTSCLNS